jgi:hypothetical protein
MRSLPPRGVATLAFAFLALASACGGHGASTVINTQSTTTDSTPRTSVPPAPPSNLTRLVLQVPDLGGGYARLPTDTHPISLAQETSNDSARATAIEQATYLGGYQTAFHRPGVDVLLSTALAYTSASAVHQVDTDPQTIRITAADLHGRRLPIPAGAPGVDPLLIQGTTLLNGRRLPADFYVWRRGTFAFAIFMIGRRADVRAVVSLAQLQDARIRRSIESTHEA